LEAATIMSKIEPGDYVQHRTNGNLRGRVDTLSSSGSMTVQHDDGVMSTWGIHDAQVLLKKFEYFQKLCLEILHATPGTSGWALRSWQDDFQREWFIEMTARVTRNGLNEELRPVIQVNSAHATRSTPTDVVAGLLRMLRQM
jgi:hypothetical protein